MVFALNNINVITNNIKLTLPNVLRIFNITKWFIFYQKIINFLIKNIIILLFISME